MLLRVSIHNTNNRDCQVENELAEVKSQAKMIFRRLNRNSEQQASIESGQYTLQYVSKQFLSPYPFLPQFNNMII